MSGQGSCRPGDSQYNRRVQSEEWGPYRIEERLGSGGMGEVYRAYDRRLDRWVALKIIRPEVSGGKKARERFRREARSAARLSHPTVLQIHDIIERDEGDGIVMELVEGETLGRILKRGPMELDRVVRLGREVAEGLAAAHARGIIHRDLKTDNVMITPEDHAKILDFGLAKRLGPSAEQSISIDGRVVGTSHAMSPEQAQGFQVDHRSDLFSLGILLYEMVGGASPFRRPALAETLTRVCVHEQAPVKELRPEVPGELSDLIDELLRKKPEDRPQEAREVALALRQLEPAVSVTMDPVSYPTMVDLPRATATGSTATIPSLGGGGEPHRRLPVEGGTESWWYRTVTLARRPVAWGSALAVIAVSVLAAVLLRPSPPPPIQVAVPAPVVTSPAAIEEPALLASSVRVAMNQALLDLKGITTLAPDQVDAVPGTSQEVARATAADEVVTSRLECLGLSCRATLNRVAANGDLLSTVSYKVTSDDLLLAGGASMDNIRQLYPEYPQRGAIPELRVSEQDYERYLEIYLASLRGESGETVTGLLSRIAEVRASSPDFLPAHLLEAELARDRYYESRDRADLERAAAIIEEARSLAPDDPRVLSTRAWIALSLGDLDRVEEALEDFRKIAPGDDELLALRAHLLEARGNVGAALTTMNEAYRRRPSRLNLYNLAYMEQRQGATKEARQHLETLLDEYPDHLDGRFLLAQLELLNGEPERAVELYEKLVAQSPGTLELGSLGLAHMVAKQYRDAAEICRRAYELDPQSPLLALNLADAEALLGRTEEARRLYERTLDLIESGSDGLSDPQVLTVRAQALAHLDRDREAVAAIQQALQLAPENPQTAFEAALVYTLVEGRPSALVNVEKALALGFDPGWFRLPWFDPLRSDPEFLSMIEAEQTPAPAD